MKKQKWIILATAAGLLATTGASAAGLIEKVSGQLRGDITVTVNGEQTQLHPVYIDGKAYIPVRDAADAFGYGISWNQKQLDLTSKNAPVGEADYAMISGVVESATATAGGGVRLEVLGTGPNAWIILTADAKSTITGADGKTIAASDLKAGMHIIAQYGPAIAKSYPGQSHAASVNVTAERLVKEQAVYSVEKADGGWRIQFSELKNGVDTPVLTLQSGKETRLVDKEGRSADWTQIKPGTPVRAYYGPTITEGQVSALDTVVVLEQQPTAEQIAAYREIAWKLVPAEQLPHLLTKKEDAQVAVIEADAAGLMPADDAAKKRVEEIKAAGGKLIAVNYSTDQDPLIGPLTIVFDPETEKLLGYFIRR
ncbi:stalk domain-containing protein [Cohnella hashimotonis]|uniref:Stalk domain-containing protein n=1 Tax=Cohnella hashimotonis TaxID=2826895 RepID=A0ABT6THQ3_9BACL|nr:stalk domain-containing protein [Cohnella hashimotonis]MDI4646250.1 stalk domain-containing protein [Cohnella hashimotonis]